MKIESKTGFTLVEVLISMVIVGILTIIAIMALNPQALIGKANDSKRKSDLNKIRTAFEEYYNDKGFYPPANLINEEWNKVDNCGKVIDGISKYLKTWPCGPNNQPYTIISNDNWFKAVTNLENKKDKDIPAEWYGPGTYTLYTATFARETVNYGTSSLNVLWYEGDVPSYCVHDQCYSTSGDSHCNAPPAGGCVTEGDTQCFIYNSMSGGCGDPVCPVSCCGRGCN